MENLRELQVQAREFERLGHHAAALELYGRILQEPGGEPDGSVWARAGQMRLALGQDAQAADDFASAVERYAAAGLHNLALNFCQRLLRLDEGRTPFLLRFGQLSAERGYGRDARHGYVEYADRIAAGGDAAGAAEVLREYLGYFPDDAAVRRRIFELTGEEPLVAPPPPPVIARTPPHEEAMPGLLPTAHEEVAPDSPAELPTLGSEDPAVGRLEGFEPTHAGESWGATPPAPEGIATHAWQEDAAAAEIDDADELPLLGTDGLSPLDAEEEAPADALPLLGGVETAPPPPPAVRATDPLERARERVREEPTSLSARRDLIALLRSRNDPRLEEAVEDAERDFAAADRASEALEFVEQLAKLRPEDTALQQRRVERALLASNRPSLVAAYLALAARFEAELDTARARETLRRVLEIDPANEEARAALGSVTPAATPPRDYVDLGELILSGTPEEMTRFQVAIGEPTGDEESDFAEILALFRKKVSESLDPKDAASHYDLGLAFKEMGLLDDAIVHLQSALRGGANPLATLEVLGQCFVLKGQVSLAARVFERATRLDGVGDSDLVGVRYGLARAQEELGEMGEARGNYERVVAVDLSFRDAAARLQALDSA